MAATTPRAAAPPELVLSHHCVRHASFEERAAAAAEAGYDGFGLNLRAYRQMRVDGVTDDEMAAVLERHGQRLVEVEAIAGWAGSPDARTRAAENEALVHHLADAFGVRYVQLIGPHDGGVADAAAAFAGVCDRAGEHDLVVGLEFLPFTNIPDVSAALAIVEKAGRPNGGVCVDAWHFFRGNRDWGALAAVPGELVFDVQIDDGPLEPEHPDYVEDTLANRRLPGHGEFDLVGLIRALDAIGVDAPISVEVISDELDALTPTAAATQMADATRRVLAAARRPTVPDPDTLRSTFDSRRIHGGGGER